MGMFGHLARLWGRKTWDPAQAILEAGYTVLDTELTGLDDRRDDIVSLGAVRMSGGRIHVGGTFGTQALSISNTLAAGTYNETLGAQLANASGVSTSGNICGVGGSQIIARQYQ